MDFLAAKYHHISQTLFKVQIFELLCVTEIIFKQSLKQKKKLAKKNLSNELSVGTDGFSHQEWYLNQTNSYTRFLDWLYWQMPLTCGIIDPPTKVCLLQIKIIQAQKTQQLTLSCSLLLNWNITIVSRLTPHHRLISPSHHRLLSFSRKRKRRFISSCRSYTAAQCYRIARNNLLR